MHHVCAPKKLLVGLLALVLGALITGSAAAAGQQVIPYLSHGVGVDQSVYSGTSTKTTKTPLVIPYLSHGHGVDQSLYVGGSHHLRRTAATAPVAKAVPDAFERAVTRREASETAAASGDRGGSQGRARRLRARRRARRRRQGVGVRAARRPRGSSRHQPDVALRRHVVDVAAAGRSRRLTRNRRHLDGRDRELVVEHRLESGLLRRRRSPRGNAGRRRRGCADPAPARWDRDALTSRPPGGDLKPALHERRRLQRVSGRKVEHGEQGVDHRRVEMRACRRP